MKEELLSRRKFKSGKEAIAFAVKVSTRKKKRDGINERVRRLWSDALVGDNSAAVSLAAVYRFKLFSWLTVRWKFKREEAEQIIMDAWAVAFSELGSESPTRRIYSSAWKLIEPFRRTIRRKRGHWPVFDLLHYNSRLELTNQFGFNLFRQTA